MRRRGILQLLCATAVFRSLFAAAQTANQVRRIVWVEAFYQAGTTHWGMVAEELRPLGWTRGRNVAADVHIPVALPDLTKIAKEAVWAQPDLIVANGGPATAALRAETRTIPILFFGVADPVGSGLVPSLTRPRGNITGFSSY